MIDRRDRIVTASLESDDRRFCVDIWRNAAGEHFWDEWRRDPEDPSGWHATGRRCATAFSDAQAATDAAVGAIAWLMLAE